MNDVNMQTEPVAIIGVIIGLAEALLALLVSFGLGLTAEQVGAIMVFVTTAGTTFKVLLSRNNVWSPRSHMAAVAKASVATAPQVDEE